MLDFSSTALDWTVDMRPIFDADGNEIDRNIGRAVVRSDTNKVIAVRAPGFKPIQHQDILDPILQKLHDDKVEIHHRVADKKTLYDLRGQKGAFVNIQTQKDGAICRFDIITGDFIEPVGRMYYTGEERGRDTMLRRITGLNSHDGTFAVTVTNGYHRVICMNGMMSTEFVATTYGKHTTNFDIKGLQAKVAMGAELLQADAERIGLYAKTPLTPKVAERFLRKTIARLANRPTGEENWSQSLVTDLLERFQREDQTVWGLVNAMTGWATHGPLKEGSGEVTARTGRDARVAQAMRSPLFSTLL